LSCADSGAAKPNAPRSTSAISIFRISASL
jgi:hypothetical protein